MSVSQIASKHTVSQPTQGHPVQKRAVPQAAAAQVPGQDTVAISDAAKALSQGQAPAQPVTLTYKAPGTR
nr:hypothetical protein [uncultured Holophaga sp.]